MRLHRWAQLAEITASLAVIITLIFLIAEVRANTRAVERQIGLDGVTRVTTPMIGRIDGNPPQPCSPFAARVGLTASCAAKAAQAVSVPRLVVD